MEKGLLWREGVAFGAAPIVEALRPWGKRLTFGALVLLGWRRGHMSFNFPSFCNHCASELNVIKYLAVVILSLLLSRVSCCDCIIMHF